MPRELEVRIAAARDIGFYASEAGIVIASFCTAREMAHWVERRLGIVDGDIEPSPVTDMTIELPTAFQQRKRSGLFGRG